jgi:hypothetical protein
MRTKHALMIVSAALTFVALPRAFAAPQGSSLEDDLKKTFKLAHTASDSSGLAITEKGTVLVIKKGGIRSFPPGDAVILPNSYNNGTMKTAQAKTLGAAGKLAGHFGIPQQANQQDNSRILPTDEKVYFTKISVDTQKDIVHVNILECDSCNNVDKDKPSNFKAQVDFQFPKGYLSGGADAGQVADMIGQVFANDTGDASAQGGGDQGQAQGQDAQQGAAQGGGQAAPAAADPPKQPQSIDKGSTEDEVIAAFGQPDKIVNLGAKKLYIYKDMKVTFVGGKVTDVQ